MAVQRVIVKLTELRCLAQSESGSGSEPYLWTTFFAFGAERQPFQTGILAVQTPSYDQFRTEFKDGMRAGSTALVPVFIASGAFDFDLDSAPQPKIVGAIAVLMEEDSTPERFMIQGRIAYSKEIEAQLQALADARVRSGDLGPLTDAEVEAIKKAVKSKVEGAVARGQNIGGLFRDQDDNIGFMFRTFTHRGSEADKTEIKHQFFNFPEVNNGSGDRFVLSGLINVGAVPKPPVIRCPAERAALQAKKDQLSGLNTRVITLQKQLQNATPQQKPAIIQSIKRTQAEAAAAEAALPALQAALDTCLRNSGPGPGPVAPGPAFPRDTGSKTR
jgi:hypothetical protein